MTKIYAVVIFFRNSEEIDSYFQTMQRADKHRAYLQDYLGRDCTVVVKEIEVLGD